MAWGKNGTPDTLTVAGDTVEITDLTATKFNTILFHQLSGTSNLIGELNLDSDAGSKYAYRRQVDGTSDVTGINQDNISITRATDTNDEFSVGYIVNIDGEEKLMMFWAIDRNSAGSANAPRRKEQIGKYVEGSTEPQFTAIRVRSDNLGTDEYGIDTNLSALGTD